MNVFQQKGCKTYRVRFSIEGRKFDVALKTRSKEVAEKKARELIKQKTAELAGLIAPLEQYETAQKPLIELLELWLENGLRPDVKSKHRRLSRNRPAAVFQECGWRYLRDISPAQFDAWRNAKSREGSSPKTLNAYLSHLSTFLKWLEERRLISENPLRVVKPLPKSFTIEPRAFSGEELTLLIGSSNPYRVNLYTIAIFTGLRKSELRELEWSAVILDGEKSVIRLNPKNTKNQKGGTLPIHPDALKAFESLKQLQNCGRSLKRAHKVFHRGIPKSPRWDMDLVEAGIQKTDELGRNLTFHSLRKTFATMLNAAGVSPRTAMALMRHSDMRLTMNTYTDASLLPLVEEMKKVPSLKSSPRSSPKTGKSCPNVSISGEIGINENNQETSVSRSKSVELGDVVQPCPKGKKVERVGFEPTVPCGTSVFKTDAFDHSATSPLSDWEFRRETPKGRRESTRMILNFNNHYATRGTFFTICFRRRA